MREALVREALVLEDRAPEDRAPEDRAPEDLVRVLENQLSTREQVGCLPLA